MAWDDDLPLMVRTLLQDVGTTTVYQDDGLIQTILLQAIVLQSGRKFANRYDVSFGNQTMRPDPTATATRDDVFTAIVVYAAAVALATSEVRILTRQGIDIQDGDQKIGLRRDAASLGLMLKAYQDKLDELLYDLATNGGDGFGEVIVTPYPYYGRESPGFGYNEDARGWRCFS